MLEKWQAADISGGILSGNRGRIFFGEVGSFEEGYEVDAIVLDDDVLKRHQELTVLERLERAFYLSLDEKKIIDKIIKGKRIFID